MSYMPAEELEAARAADPVPAYRAWLVAGGHASDEDLAAIDKRVEEEVEDAWAFAKSSPEPNADELFRDVLGATA
jgi:pyruvate dehydrogenase E1 component alpha subunit